MRCKDARQLMMALLDGVAGAEGRVGAHLEACATCAAEWDGLARMEALLRSHGLVDPPVGFAARVMSAVDREFAPMWLFYLRRGTWVVTGAVVVLAGLLSLQAGWQGVVDAERVAPIVAGVGQAALVLAQTALAATTHGTGAWLLYCVMGAAIAVGWFGSLILPRLARRSMTVAR